MRQIFQYKKFDAVTMAALIVIWLLAYKSADVFNFFKTYSSLWFLPSGVTLSIALVVPVRFVIAPLLANLLLVIPAICVLLGIEHTGYLDPIIHSFRLFAVYAGAGLLLRYVLKIALPINNLSDQLKIIVVALSAAVVGGFSGVSMHAFSGNFPWTVAWEILLPWIVGDGIGALIVPPILVPLLCKFFKLNPYKPLGVLPSMNLLVFQAFTILLTMYVAFDVSTIIPNLDSLWYFIVLPPIIFAVHGGVPSAASAIAITALLTPLVATFLGYEGERTSLQFILVIAGSVGLMIGAAITDRDNAFLVVKLHEAELENQVEKRTQELNDAYQFQKHLIRSIGHDLQQPVFALNNVVSSIKHAVMDPEIKHSLLQAETIGQTTMRFVTQTLDYARREAGQGQVEVSEFSVQNIFEQVQAMFANDAEERGVRLVIHPSDIQLSSDEHLVLETISNLVQNAIRLSIDGELVEIRAGKEKHVVFICVTDQVVGYQVAASSTGFGLEIVRQISQLLNLELDFRPNQFRILFP